MADTPCFASGAEDGNQADTRRNPGARVSLGLLQQELCSLLRLENDAAPCPANRLRDRA